MKIILYILLILLVAAAAYGIYYVAMQGTFTGVADSITNGINSAAEWINDKISSLIN